MAKEDAALQGRALRFEGLEASPRTEIWTCVQRLLFSRQVMPASAAKPSAETAEVWLRKATLAQDSKQRASFARKGLRARGGRDPTLRAMLLRQVYLSFMEDRRFGRALQVATEIIALGVMPDVARQDAARACLGLDAVQDAVGHLRIACRVCPASRRAFHSWTLGSVYYLSERYHEAMAAFRRAAVWGTTDKPLYRAQLALATLAAGHKVDDLEGLRDALDDAPCGQGYGKFVLGELAFYLGDLDEAHACLGSFVKRTSGGRVALQVALERELEKARLLLGRLDEARIKRA